MPASWYDRQGPAAEVLQLGELPDPTPGPGEVRVRVTVSGANPGDTKKLRGWTGSAMPFPRVIRTATPPASSTPSVTASTCAASGRACGCTAPSPTAPSVLPPSTPSPPATSPSRCPDHLPDDLGASLRLDRHPPVGKRRLRP
jgi:NADPH:quinone reductase